MEHNKAMGIIAEKIKNKVPKNVRKDFKEKFIGLMLRRFKPKILFELDINDKYQIKTARTHKELIEVLRLRYEVFLGVLEQHFDQGIDFDKYDLLGDHILLIEKSTDKIIGTYRLMCSLFTDSFYSENEFTIEEFLKVPGIKLELGRACIHPDYRNGVTINLVWKGLGKYVSLVEADYLFGCSSVNTVSYRASQNFLQSLGPDKISDQWDIKPKAPYLFQLSMSDMAGTANPTEVVDMPPLLGSYFKAGAKVYSPPALDRDFSCIDLLTILNMRDLDPKYRKRYLG